jgi:hypothetical protein
VISVPSVRYFLPFLARHLTHRRNGSPLDDLRPNEARTEATVVTEDVLAILQAFDAGLEPTDLQRCYPFLRLGALVGDWS